MRVAVLAILPFLLAGCTQGDPGVGGDGGFETSCPAWVKYPHNGQIIEGGMQWTNLSTNIADLERWDFMKWNDTRGGQGIGDGNLLSYDEHPLDQVWFDFHQREKAQGQPRRLLYVQDAELHIRFFPSEGGYPGGYPDDPMQVYDAAQGKSSARGEWVFGIDPAKGFAIHNVTLRADLAEPDQKPAPAGIFVEWILVPDLDRNPDTASVALMHYAPEFWYRTCYQDADGHRIET